MTYIQGISSLAPDMVLWNGKIVPLDQYSTVATAIAIKWGRIIAIGLDNTIVSLADSSTRVIDLGGKMVVPGFIDSHNHLDLVGINLLKVSLVGVQSIADIVERLRERAKEIPPGEWIETAITGEPTISSLLAEKRYPTRWELDAASTDHPIVIRAPHVAVVNSCALQLAGLSKHTPDPSRGQIPRDGDGEPTGVLLEEAAVPILRLLPPLAYEDRVEAIRRACQAYSAVGLTSVIQHGIDAETLRAWREVVRRDEATVRAYTHLWLGDNMGSDIGVMSREDLNSLVRGLAWAAYPGLGDDFLKVGGIKIILDGGVGLGTALMREPYRAPGGKTHYGIQRIPNETLRTIIGLADAHDLRLAVHQSGGRACDLVFNMYEEFSGARPLGAKRHVAVHCQFPSEENFGQAKRLNLHVATQTLFLYSMGAQYVHHLGHALTEQANPLRDWLDHGIPISLGSDAPVNPYEPLLGIWHAATRECTNGEVLGVAQRISQEEALRCYTINGAWASFEEEVKGSLEVGKMADLVVLSDDILNCPVDQIRRTRVFLTIVGGRIVCDGRQEEENESH